MSHARDRYNQRNFRQSGAENTRRGTDHHLRRYLASIFCSASLDVHIQQNVGDLLVVCGESLEFKSGSDHFYFWSQCPSLQGSKARLKSRTRFISPMNFSAIDDAYISMAAIRVSTFSNCNERNITQIGNVVAPFAVFFILQSEGERQ